MWIVCVRMLEVYVCVCGGGLVIIPVHVSPFVIHAMTSSAITTRLSGEP